MHGAGAGIGRKIILLIMAAGLAAGCGTATPEPPTPTAIPPSATATTPPTATVLPTYTPFVPKGTVKIVSQSPNSTDIWRAAQLAVTKLSGPLNELGYEVVYRGYDDEDNVDKALAYAAEIIDDPDVLCGVGHYTSRVTLNATEKYHLAGLAFISPSATHPKVTDRHYAEVSRVGGRDDVQGSVAVRFAVDRDAQTVYIVRVNMDYFHRLAEAFRKEATRAGVRVVGDGQLGGENEALKEKIVAANPDLVFFTGFSNEAGPFFRQLRQAGYMGMLLAAYGSPELARGAGPQAKDGDGTFYMLGVTPTEAYEGTAQFLRDFQAAYHATPKEFAAEAYDAAGICLKAIEQATTANDGDLPTRADVVQAVRAIEDYPGITGTISFNEDGDPLLTNYFVMQLVQLDSADWSKNPIAGIYAVPPPE